MLASVSERSVERTDPGLERGRGLPASRRLVAPPVSELAAVSSRRGLGLQARLEVGRSDDPLEHEADRVAERLTAAPPGLLRRACACGGTPGPDGECAACKARRLGLQRRAAGDGPGHAPAIVHEVLGSPGRPLDSATRTDMEGRLGRDLGDVRVHTGDRAAASSRAVGALAYTVGSDVVFERGRYAPRSPEGRRLLAHELAHVAQQDERHTPRLARKPASKAQAYGDACSTGAENPCQVSRCSKGEVRTALEDLDQGLDYVRRAAAAARASPLTDSTIRALDWYFNDHGPTTAQEAARRFDCIGECLTDTSVNQRIGCHPGYGALAYVCAAQTPVCSLLLTEVCLTDKHFRRNARTRAETAVHECAHRVGMSLGSRHYPGFPDVYDHRSRFAFLDTAESLVNSDSFAGFAGAISEDKIPVSVFSSGGMSAGGAFPVGAGEGTWYARLYLGQVLQHPVLGFINPTLGVGISVIGESTSTGAESKTTGPSELISLLGGVRITDPRPGETGAGYFSLYGGPAVVFGLGLEPSVKMGAEAGVGVGYRWRWLTVEAGVGYAWDPTRAAGMEHMTTATAGFTIALETFEKKIEETVE